LCLAVWVAGSRIGIRGFINPDPVLHALHSTWVCVPQTSLVLAMAIHIILVTAMAIPITFFTDRHICVHSNAPAKHSTVCITTRV
jgi:hypothetical protein